MQAIIVEKPYQFVPPHRGDWIPSAIQATRLIDIYLRRFEGIESYEVRGRELLQQSLSAEHGILLAPNHCRYADPIAMGWLAREAGTHVYAMASWHLFNANWLQSFAIRMCGGFSVYREGMDRKSLDTAVDALVSGERPLVVFPEGTVHRSNDVVQPLLDGVSFIARTAARKRSKAGNGKVVVHPIAIKYLLRGDVTEVAEPTLKLLEDRFLTRKNYRPESLLVRLNRLNEAVLCLRETNCLGGPGQGDEEQRRRNLVEALLQPHERRWLTEAQNDQANQGSVIQRIKQLRIELVPKLLGLSKRDEEYREIWDSLDEIYIAQQIGLYPVDYLDNPTDTRALETVERIYEDITDKNAVHGKLHCVIEVGEAIEVAPTRAARGQADPLTSEIHGALSAMLEKLSGEARPLE